MKLQDTNINVTTSGVLSEGDFGISHNDRAHVISILRDKLYSDKFGAIVREYCANAWDAHAESGLGDRPIKVTGPTRWEPTLSIRDYGTGLDKEGIYEVYAKYGRSTKRNSNTAIGMLGLGSKSAFAYNNTFTIISHCNGVRTTYCAYIDETNIGKISELQSVATTETGIEIQIPIRAADIDVIKDRCMKLLPYFHPAPECNYTIVQPEYSVKGESWGIRTDFGTGPMAVMGNVPYPIDATRIPELDGPGKEILQCGIDIWFPIGELSVSASREQLEYTDDSRKAIFKRLKVIRNEILANLKIEFDSCPNVWAARMFYQKTQRTSTAQGRHTGYGYNTRNIVATLAASTFNVYHGIRLDAPSLEFDKLISDQITVRYLAGNSHKASDSGSASWRRQCTMDDQLIVWKNDIKSSWLKTALYWRNREAAGSKACKNLLVIDFKGEVDSPDFDAAITKYCADKGLTGITIIKASSVELPEETITNSNGKITKVINAKAKAKVFAINPQWTYGAHPASKNWIPAEMDLEDGTGAYTVIFGFEPVEDGGPTTGPSSRTAVLQLLFALDIDVTKTPIYGIRTEMKDKIGPGWVDVKTWGIEEAKRLLQLSPKRVELINQYISQNYSVRRGLLDDDEVKKFISLVEEPNFLAAINTIRSAESFMAPVDYQIRQKYQTILSALRSDIMADISSSIKVIRDLETKYPLLENLQMFHNGAFFRGKDWAAPFAEYINIMKNKEE